MAMKTHIPLASFMDLLLDTICVVDAEGYFVFVSAACERIFGYTADEMIGKAMIEMVAPEDRERTLQAAGRIMAGQPNPHFENRYIRKDGRVVHIMWSARWSETDRLRIAVARDITERKRAESMQAALYAISEAAHSSRDLAALFEQIHQIIGQLLPAQNFSVALLDEKTDQLSFPYHVDTHGEECEAQSPEACAFSTEIIRTGQSLLTTSDTLAILPGHLRAIFGKASSCWLGVPLNSNRGTIGALVLKSYSGEACYTDKDQELLQYVSTQVATAIERKQLLAKLQYMAQYDELTKLPNRGLLYDRLKTALARARREQGQLSLLYLDLDRFKHVNDTYGHATGDLLLQEVANRLTQCVREVDTVARIGGDEFVVLLESPYVAEHVTIVVEKIRQVFANPLEIDGYHLPVLPSIGIAHYPEHGDGERQLLKHADDNMYLAKKSAERIAQPESTDPAI